MPETAFTLNDKSNPTSSDPNRDVWIHRTPNQLFDEGYAEHVDFGPSQTQSTVPLETKIEEMRPGTEKMSTEMRSSDGLIIQLPVPTPMRPIPTMHPLQEWEGYVLEKGEDEFSARLLDLTIDSLDANGGRMREEEAQIPLSEISDDDVQRLRPGSVFRWVIGYERSASGTKRRVSQIVFRDLPAMTRQDISEGREWAHKVAQSTGI